MSGLPGRQRSIAAVLILAFITGSLVLAARRITRPSVTIDPGPAAGRAGYTVEAAEKQEPSRSQKQPAMIVVHVCGAVAKPGVYTLPEGSRVADAVKSAGGLTGNASAESVNMARVLVDSTQVYIPAKDPSRPAEAKAATAAGKDADRAQVQALPDPGAPAKAGVNINTATLAELDALPGIGPALARRILEFRNMIGRFERPEQLMDVSGIGPHKYAALKDLVTVY